MGGAKLNRVKFCIFIFILAAGLFPESVIPGFSALAAQETAVDAAPAEALTEADLILEDGPDLAPSGGSSVFTAIRMVLALGLAAAAVYGVVYFLRRASKPQDIRNSHLKILTSAHLGSNRYLYVISLGEKAWLVGAGEGGVSLIAEVDDREALDAMALDESKRGAESSRFLDFRSLLRKFQGGSSKTGAGISGLSADKLRESRERLKRL